MGTGVVLETFNRLCGSSCRMGVGESAGTEGISELPPCPSASHCCPRTPHSFLPAPGPSAAPLTSVKCGSLLGLFCRKPSPSTQLRRGPSTLQAQARVGSSAPAPCSAPCPALSPWLGPCCAHLSLPAVGVLTGCSPSMCLPLGTSSTSSVCTGASMLRGHHGSPALTPTHPGICGADSQSDHPCSLHPGPSRPKAVSAAGAPRRGSLRTQVPAFSRTS